MDGVNWATAHGASLQYATLANLPGRGTGVVAFSPIRAGEVILRVPHSLLLTSTDEAGARFGATNALALALLQERDKSNSFWSKYLSTLPGIIPTPLHFNETEQDDLVGTDSSSSPVQSGLALASAPASCYHRLSSSSSSSSSSGSYSAHVDGGSDLEVGDSLLDRLAASTYDLVGMSVGSLDDARPCSDAITEIRARHRSPKLWIAVGGPAVVCNRRAFEGIGADIVASTAMEAVRMADRLVH